MGKRSMYGHSLNRYICALFRAFLYLACHEVYFCVADGRETEDTPRFCM